MPSLGGMDGFGNGGWAGGGDARADEASMRSALVDLAEGKAIVLPTDTVYGLGVRTDVAGATAQLFALKGRGEDVALPVLVADAAQARKLGVFGPLAEALAERFWPGGLTLVVPRAGGVDVELGGDPTMIGLRHPNHRVPTELAAVAGPLAVTSANAHGEPTPHTAAGAAQSLTDFDGLVIDAGPCAGAPSTVVRVVGTTCEVLRSGSVDPAEIDAVVESVGRSPA